MIQTVTFNTLEVNLGNLHEALYITESAFYISIIIKFKNKTKNTDMKCNQCKMTVNFLTGLLTFFFLKTEERTVIIGSSTTHNIKHG